MNELAVSAHSALHHHHRLSSMNRSKDYPGFWHAVLLCVIFIALQLVLVIPVAISDAVFKTRLVAHPAVLGIVNLLACALMVTTGWLIGRPAMVEVFALRRVSGPALGSVIVASAGAIILLSEADNLFKLILPPPEWIARIFNELSAPSEHFWTSVFLLVIVAPLTEEVMFRGLILRAFLQRFRGGVAFLLSSILFGLVHLNPWQFVSAFALGLMFAWYYARTRSMRRCRSRSGDSMRAIHSPAPICNPPGSTRWVFCCWPPGFGCFTGRHAQPRCASSRPTNSRRLRFHRVPMCRQPESEILHLVRHADSGFLIQTNLRHSGTAGRLLFQFLHAPRPMQVIPLSSTTQFSLKPPIRRPII